MSFVIVRISLRYDLDLFQVERALTRSKLIESCFNFIFVLLMIRRLKENEIHV